MGHLIVRSMFPVSNPQSAEVCTSLKHRLTLESYGLQEEDPTEWLEKIIPDWDDIFCAKLGQLTFPNQLKTSRMFLVLEPVLQIQVGVFPYPER